MSGAISGAGRHTLTLDVVEARCQLVGSAADAPAVERRLERVSREDLAQAIGDAVRGPLGGDDAEVVRIDRITLDLVLTREAFETSELARLWGQRISAAVAAALARPGHPGVARFPGHAEYIAAYVEHRFGVGRHPRHAFAEFGPLEHVSPSEAAAELLAARPGYLPALARWGAGAGDPAWLARRLDTSPCERLLDALAPTPGPPDAAMATLVRRLVATAPPGWRALPAPAAALALVLGGLGDDPRGAPGPSLDRRVAVARAVAAVAQVADIASDLVGQLGQDGTAPGGWPQASTSAGLRREVASSRALLAGPDGRRLAAVIVDAVGHARPVTLEPAPGRRPTPGRRGRPQPSRLDSPFAGFVLVLPVLRGLALDTLLSPGQARALVAEVIAAPAPMANQVEVLCDVLLPFPVEAEPPPWPAADADAPDDQRRTGPGPWAARLLDAFTERLPGLGGSSAPYVRRQFLHLGGTLELEPRLMTVHLARPPLAIVLTIGGLVGDLGPLSWRRDHSLRVVLR